MWLCRHVCLCDYAWWMRWVGFSLWVKKKKSHWIFLLRNCGCVEELIYFSLLGHDAQLFFQLDPVSFCYSYKELRFNSWSELVGKWVINPALLEGQAHQPPQQLFSLTVPLMFWTNSALTLKCSDTWSSIEGENILMKVAGSESLRKQRSVWGTL